MALFGPFADHSLLKGKRDAQLSLSCAIPFLVLLPKIFFYKEQKGFKGK
jgi:hypothetical protein